MGKARSISLFNCIEIADKKGGLCLSKTYVKSSSKLTWSCNQSHIWDASYNQIQSGKWCPFCAGKNKSIQDCQLIAESHDGKCLSLQYLGVKYKYKWICSDGHIWNATMDKIKNGQQWCPHCAGNVAKNIKECHQIAEIKGGKFLSDEYKLAGSKYKWECHKSHQWISTYNDVQQGRWCPICSQGFGEKLTRYCFEKMFGCNFDKIKPDWMINPNTGCRLELDGYNSDLHIAFEHQGIHHEEDCPKENFMYHQDQVFKDEIKRRKCKERGITLIEVSEIGRRLKLNDVVSFLLSEFEKHNIAYPESAKNFQIDLKEFYEKYCYKSSNDFRMIDQLDANNNLIKRWNNVNEAVLLSNPNSINKNIYKCLRGERKFSMGSQWKYSRNEQSTTGVEDLMSQIDEFEFSDDFLFVDSIMDEVNNLDFDDPDLFN